MKATLLFLLFLFVAPSFAEPAAPGGDHPSEPSAPPVAAAVSAPAAPAEQAEPAAPAPPAAPAKQAEPAAPAPAAPAAPAAEKPAPPSGGAAVEPEAPRKAACGAARPRREACLPSRVTLSDGSVLKGVLRRRFLPADTDTIGRIRIDLRAVASIDAGAPQRDAPPRYSVAFKNGDRLTVGFPADMKPLPFDTVIGRVFLPLPAVSGLVLEPPPASTPNLSPLTPTLIYHCTFDSPSAIARPAAGPAGRFFGGTFVPGKFGNALRTYADEPAAEVDFEPGLLGTRGTIEFWAKKEGDKSGRFADLGNLRFFGLWLHAKGETPPWCSTHFQFTSNDGMGMSGLCGMVNHCSWATNPSFGGNPYGLIRDSLADWHHYAVTWDAEGLPGTTASDGEPAVVEVFLDGKPVSTQGRQTLSFGSKHLKAIPGFFAKLAFPTPSNGWGSSGGHIPFLIDEFKIWSVVKTDFSDSGSDRPIQHSAFGTQHSKLLYHCTFDDAQSVEHPATGPDGKFLGGEFVPGKVGNALFVKAGTHAAEVPFPTGLMQPQGCIEFWGKIPGATKETTYPDGGNPQFFAMGVGKWVNTFVKYTSNDGFGTGGLHADLPGSAYVSSLPSWGGSAAYPDFLGDPAAWHHYLLDWSDQGLDAASEALGRRVLSALYVDGRLVNPAYGTNGPDRAKFLRQFSDLPVVLAFPIVPGRQDFAQNRVDYLIDDFKVWNFPKTEFAVP